MFRRLFLFTGLALAVLAGAACNDDEVTGPGPMMTATATPPPGMTPTPTPPPAANRVVDVGPSGSNAFVDRQSGTSTSTISVGTTIDWVWLSGIHSTTSGSCTGTCTPDGIWDSGVGSGMTFSRTFNQAGTFSYFCITHGAMMQGTVIVQ